MCQQFLIRSCKKDEEGGGAVLRPPSHCFGSSLYVQEEGVQYDACPHK